MDSMTDAEYTEALAMARESLSNGGQRTFLARALLLADAAVLTEREACIADVARLVGPRAARILATARART